MDPRPENSPVPQKRKRPDEQTQLTAPDAASTAAPIDPTDDPTIYRFQRRLPMRPHSTKRDIFVTRSAKFKAMRSRALALLDKNSQPVKLHAMGAAITRCCDLALAVQAYADGQVDLDIQTATVEVYDEFEPLVEGYPTVTKTRSKSAIYISMTKTSEYV